MNEVLVARHLTRVFTEGSDSIRVLNDVNLSVSKGEMIAITGPSGSGKSTLLQLLGGLDDPTQGTVTLGGQIIHTLSECKRSELRNRFLGFVYQFHHLLPEFTALENVSMPLLMRNISLKKVQEYALHLLNQVGLSHHAHHSVGILSGGERQRVAIARALVIDPHCVLADEPTGNLDRDTGMRIMDVLFQCNSALQVSLVLVTHNLDFAHRMQRMYVLDQGGLKEVQTQ